jgi:hypothetical protein
MKFRVRHLWIALILAAILLLIATIARGISSGTL